MFFITDPILSLHINSPGAVSDLLVPPEIPQTTPGCSGLMCPEYVSLTPLVDPPPKTLWAPTESTSEVFRPPQMFAGSAVFKSSLTKSQIVLHLFSSSSISVSFFQEQMHEQLSSSDFSSTFLFFFSKRLLAKSVKDS